MRPDNTRLIRVEEGWGRANACHLGALAADGDVLHWYDADMLAHREEVEAHARWHHLVDYAVPGGHKLFVDPASLLEVDPAVVRDRVAAGEAGELFPGQEHEPHQWVEDYWAKTHDLREAGPRAQRFHIGMTGSVTKALYLDSDGFDRTLRLGEDMHLGHSLAQAGGVFVRRPRGAQLAPRPLAGAAPRRAGQPVQRPLPRRPRADDAAQAQPSRARLPGALPRGRPRVRSRRRDDPPRRLAARRRRPRPPGERRRPVVERPRRPRPAGRGPGAGDPPGAPVLPPRAAGAARRGGAVALRRGVRAHPPRRRRSPRSPLPWRRSSTTSSAPTTAPACCRTTRARPRGSSAPRRWPASTASPVPTTTARRCSTSRSA